MFETSVVRARAGAARGRLSLLTISVIAHTAAILGTVAVSIASVDFPAHAPNEFAHAPELTPVRIPPPLGDPNGGARRETPQPAQQPRQAAAPVQPTQPTAPSTIPEHTTEAAQAPVNAGSGGEGIPGATSTAPLGLAWGTENSPGDLDAPPAPATTVQPVQEKIYEAHEVKAPVLLHKVTPEYPAILRNVGMRATVVVRCIIDKNGRVRDAQVTVPAMPPFNQAVLNAIEQWRYTPGSRNGVAVETYLNVTVTFSTTR